MTFSNVNIFRNTVSSLSTAAGKNADQITTGGAFAPNTYEAVTLMRSELDNGWENSYITKYQATMQNRLNRLKQELTDAYKALLDTSSVQQISEAGLTQSNSAATDVYGNIILGNISGTATITASNPIDIALSPDKTAVTPSATTLNGAVNKTTTSTSLLATLSTTLAVTTVAGNTITVTNAAAAGIKPGSTIKLNGVSYTVSNSYTAGNNTVTLTSNVPAGITAIVNSVSNLSSVELNSVNDIVPGSVLTIGGNDYTVNSVNISAKTVDFTSAAVPPNSTFPSSAGVTVTNPTLSVSVASGGASAAGIAAGSQVSIGGQQFTVSSELQPIAKDISTQLSSTISAEYNEGDQFFTLANAAVSGAAIAGGDTIMIGGKSFVVANYNLPTATKVSGPTSNGAKNSTSIILDSVAGIVANSTVIQINGQTLNVTNVSGNTVTFTPALAQTSPQGTNVSVFNLYTGGNVIPLALPPDFSAPDTTTSGGLLNATTIVLASVADIIAGRSVINVDNQIRKVIGVSGNTVTLDSGLEADVNLGAGVTISNPPILGDTVVNLSRVKLTDVTGITAGSSSVSFGASGPSLPVINVDSVNNIVTFDPAATAPPLAGEAITIHNPYVPGSDTFSVNLNSQSLPLGNGSSVINLSSVNLANVDSLIIGDTLQIGSEEVTITLVTPPGGTGPGVVTFTPPLSAAPPASGMFANKVYPVGATSITLADINPTELHLGAVISIPGQTATKFRVTGIVSGAGTSGVILFDPPLDTKFASDASLKITVASEGIVTGTGTKFLSELRIGDTIRINDTPNGVPEFAVVNDISSDTSLTLDSISNIPTGTTTISLPRSAETFRGLTYYNSQDELDAGDTTDGTAADGVPSYYVDDILSQYDENGVATTRAGRYEMRRLYVAGPALQIVNDMKVTMRTEEVPPKKVTTVLDFLGLGAAPFTAGEKVAEYSAEVKTGGYWSSINYLFNFSPREMKYSYVTAYSTTTEEAGTRQDDGGGQATLFNQVVADARDSGGSTGLLGANNDAPTSEDGTLPGFNSTSNVPMAGGRIKWVSSNASDGYLVEKSAVFSTDGENGVQMDNYDDRLITRRATDNDNQFNRLATDFNSFDDVVKGSYSGFSNISGWTSPDGTSDVQQVGDKQIQFGSEELGDGNFQDRIRWEFAHDGVGAADLNRDGLINSSDVHTAKAAYINHYIVSTQEVEMNSSADSWGTIQADDTVDGNNNIIYKRQQLLRSVGVDGSADHVLNDIKKTLDANGNTIIDQNDANGDNDLSGDDADVNEKLLLAGSGKISKNFDGSYVSRQYQIKSFNGQNIATNSANVSISSQNSSDPVVLAEYEGFARAKLMSAGVADDVFSDATAATRTREAAVALAKKYQIEINASSMTDTDWHYSDYVSVIPYTTTSDTSANAGDKTITLSSVANIIANRTEITIGNQIRKVVSISGNTVTLDSSLALNVANGSDVKINNRDEIMFRNVTGISYVDNGIQGTVPIDFDPSLRDGVTGAVPTGTSFDDVTVAFRKTFNLKGLDFQSASFATSNDPNFYINTPTYTSRDAFVKVTENGTGGELIVNGNKLTGVAGVDLGGGVYNLKNYLVEGDNVIAYQTKYKGNGADSFKLESVGTSGTYANAADIDTMIGGKISTVSSKAGDDKLDELNDTLSNTHLSSWQSKLMVQKATTQDELNTVGSRYTQTRVKDTNPFARVLTEIMNKPEYQDIFALGLLNSANGKGMVIKAQISAPTGGSLNSTIEIRYDPVTCKFVIVQNKFEALG